MPHPEPPEYKFQKLEVYQLGLDFVDSVYELTNELPDSERFNLRSQLERAATSIVLNIAEGSTGQTDMEQNRFLGMALWKRHLGHQVFVKLQALRRALKK